ncbi:hypothetical protein SMACR_08823 [Sordaria macrospora]|uniref:WGS project CABT00000000 data, contig 2.66 n=2 Tax=Sordaria macrospora TaxID=5147 RepID=F7WAW9_SORMK|nr:uncharacterized protein SMAC_08823 [Sordaria macrospora k-hell]KAA8628051.1 hypothetical protein SMACR_08823 [Sordaria macrospora]WPJ62828.1 hypothetical protein SMAC4_08823 [Sordaria macrospora]CCC14284.1 unnamed protein product [Sordaria macrospora k-hell]
MDAPANRDVNGPGVAPCPTTALNSSHSKAHSNASKTPKIPSPMGPSTSINMTPNGATLNAASYPTPVSTLVPLCNDDSTVSPKPLQPILPADANPVGGTSNTALPVESNFLPTPPADLISPSQLTPHVHSQQQEEEVQQSERPGEQQQQEQLQSQEHHRRQKHLYHMHQLQAFMALYQRREQLPLPIQQQLEKFRQKLQPQVMHPPSSFVSNQPRTQDQASSSKPTAVPDPSSHVPHFPMHRKQSLETHDSKRLIQHNLHYQQVLRKDPHLALLLQDKFMTRLELQSLLPNNRPPKQFVSMREVQKAPSNMYEWQAEREIQKKNEELLNKKRLEEMRMALDHIYGVQSGGRRVAGGSGTGHASGSGKKMGAPAAAMRARMATAMPGGSGSAHPNSSGTKTGAPAAAMRARVVASIPAAMPAAQAAGVGVDPRLNGGNNGSDKRKAEAGTGTRPEKRSRMEVNTGTGAASVLKPVKEAGGPQKSGDATKAGGSQSVGESQKAEESRNAGGSQKAGGSQSTGGSPSARESKATEGAQHKRIAEFRKNGTA